ncbi:enterochelin esterase-like enzyme [Leptolyngbyaceae cyanobacterium JSC-12]|nr:enterochelin esterase-like enzyme [Leptolyngbyaceae cyanobacterium JSC-12]
MKKRIKRALLASMIALASLVGGGYWYVFMAGAPQLDAPSAEQNTGLTFRVNRFYSRAMGSERRYGVVLPPDYATHPQQRYPVIILLHGGHGSERDYEDKAKLTSVLHDLYRTDRLPPAIVVTPDGNDRRGSTPFFDPDYFDGPNGNVATLISTDLVQTVKARYRTFNQPELWAIGGLSSGAYGAFNIGLRHPDQFRTFFSHTGYFTDDSGSSNSPQVFITQMPMIQRRHLRVYLDAGDADHLYLEATRSFHQTLTQLGIMNEFHIFPGGHGIIGENSGWNYWHKHLADSLSFIGRQFKLALNQSKTHSQPKTHSQQSDHSPQK